MRNYIIFLGLFTFPVQSLAECTPETIQFYLDKGFNQEQITKLCSLGTGSSTPKYEPYQKPVVIYQEGGYKPGISAEEQKAIKEVKGAIDGRSVDVTEDSIEYIRNVCLRAGNAKDVDQRAEKCIDVAYSIARKDLAVLESGRGLILFGQIELEVVSSDIKRKTVVANPWDAFSPDLRFQFKRKYESTEVGNQTTIPIRRSASTGQVVNALKVIASATQLRDDGKYDTEVARVLDDSYVAPTEEEYAATRPAPDVEEEKKKKKWWNPFD